MSTLWALALASASLGALTVVGASVALAVARRSAQLSPRLRVGAPLKWMVAPTRPAILHRRLRAAVGALRTTIPAPRRRSEPSRLQDLAADVEALAAETDRSLLLAARQPSRRSGAAIAEARVQVRRVEEMVERLCSVAAELDPTAPLADRWHRRANHLDDVLRAFEAASDELRDLAPDWARDLLDGQPQPQSRPQSPPQ